MNEWRDVAGYEGHYQVSRTGQVKSLKRAGKLLSLVAGERGYVQVNLYREGHPRSHLVHRLVASAFLGRVEGKEVNHKDGVKTHNAVDNLEIVTSIENKRHAERTGLLRSRGERNANAKLTDEKVRRMRRLRADGVRVAALASEFGVSRRVVYLVCSRRAWRHVA